MDNGQARNLKLCFKNSVIHHFTINFSRRFILKKKKMKPKPTEFFRLLFCMNHLFVKRCKTGFVANSAPSSTDRTQWLGSCIYLSYSPKKHGFHTANKWQELFRSFTPDSTNVLSKSGDWNHCPLTLPVTSVYAYRSDIHVVDRECQFLGKAPRIWWGLKKRKKLHCSK